MPVLGIVYAPVRNRLFIGSSGGAEEMETSPDHAVISRRAIAARIHGSERVAVCSRSHRTPETDRFLSDNHIDHCVSVGSSMKFCLIACGEADIYPRFGPTMEWDTAAGDAVLRAAGGLTTTFEGKPLIYGQRAGDGAAGFANPDFVAFGPERRPFSFPDKFVPDNRINA